MHSHPHTPLPDWAKIFLALAAFGINQALAPTHVSDPPLISMAAIDIPPLQEGDL